MYQEFYNLKSMPFQLTPDPKFFYASPGHKRVLSYLQYGVHQGDGFIVVTGDIGTGKTTLIRRLLDDLKKETAIVAAQIVSTQLESDDLLRMVSSAFGLKYEGLNKPTLLRNLESFFKKLAKEGKRVLLIVDEAQNLPIKSLEELRMLSNYQDGNRALFQSFLIGQEEFRNLIRVNSLEQLRQRIIASYHLGPLNLDETETYIMHRLTTSGWDNDPIIDKDVISEIYNYTQGVPRRINTFCDRLLLFGALQESHTIDKVIVEKVGDELNLELQGNIKEENNIEAISAEIDRLPNRRILDLESRIKVIEDYVMKLRELFADIKATTDKLNIKK